MSVVRFAAAASTVAMLGSCGGGGGSSGGGSGGPPPAPTTATLPVTLSATSADVTVAEGATATFGFTASYTGTSTQPVIADVVVGGKRYALAEAPTGAGSQFSVNLKTADFAPGGKTTSQVTFRLCTSSDCATVYPGSTKAFTVNLDVQLKDWATFQRDNAHNAYVAAVYNPADFQRVWDWQGPVNGRIRPPAATADRVLITVGRDGGRPFDQSARTIAFDAATGQIAWSYDMGSQFHMSGPTVSDGLVHVSSMVSSSDRNPQWVFDLATGAFRNQMVFASQWADFGQPTTIGTNVYVAAGMFGSVIYGYEGTAGTKLWETVRTGGAIWGGQSMAADDRYLYYYSGAALDQIDSRNGAIVKSILNPADRNLSTSYESGPVLGQNGQVYLFDSHGRFDIPSVILGMSLTTSSILWTTPAEYTTAFAYRKGVIYAARQDARVLSAIDASTGVVLWSAPLPGNEVITGNVVVTENLAFVSSEATTWAIDLRDSTHPVVWTAPSGGRLAITPGNLLLTTGNNRLTVYRLF